MAANLQYTNEIHKQFGYLATWLPTAPIAVGDVGTVDRGIFTKIGTLKDFGISYEEKEHAEKADLEYTSADAVDINFASAANAPIAGNVPAKAEGDVTVSFKHADAILFQASQCTTVNTSNIFDVSKHILDLFNGGRWPKNQVVITDVIRATATTVLISSGAAAHVTLRIKADIGSEKLKLASANASFDIQSSSSIGTSIISKGGLTPLFIARGVKSSLFSWNDPALVTRKEADGLKLEPLGSEQLLEVSPDGTRAG